MERIRDNDHLRDIHVRGAGYVFNDVGGARNTTYSKAVSKLHRATCTHCDPDGFGNAMRASAWLPKVFFADRDEADDWLRENRHGNWSACGVCIDGERP